MEDNPRHKSDGRYSPPRPFRSLFRLRSMEDSGSCHRTLMKTYLARWLTLTLFMVATVAVVNLIVDPYGIFRMAEPPGTNSVKPAAGSRGAMAKAYQVTHVLPRGLILGNSRMEVGFDPADPTWPVEARPVYNLALPGTGTSTSLRYLRHTLAALEQAGRPKPRMLVWGVDFIDFLVDADHSPHVMQSDEESSRLLNNPDGSLNAARWVKQVRDYGEATFTLSAFVDSIETLANQENRYAKDLTSLGFNPMRDYVKITADEGYWGVFHQKDIENIKAFQRRPKSIYEKELHSSGPLRDFQEIINICRKNNVSLHLMIYPYHAHFLETMRITGHWSAFEDWKREITRLVYQEARHNQSSPFPLWDFSGAHRVSMEKIPEKTNKLYEMKWYWEAGHFKSGLGRELLKRMMGHQGSDRTLGVILTPENIEEVISTARLAQQSYLGNPENDVTGLEKIALDNGFSNP